MTQRPAKIQAIKGTRDILPPESALWNRVEQIARDVFATYGFGEIRPPIFEQTELFARSVGVDTDVVSKEMYSFEDKAREIFEEEDFSFIDEGVDEQDPNSIEDFSNRTLALASKIELAMKTGLIPSSPRNNRVVQLIRNPENIHSEPIRKALELSGEDVRISAYQSYLLVLRGDLDATFGQSPLEGYSLSLRPEATASVCRAYIEHGMHTWPGDVKLYYIGPMFRRERPQKGRYRQFYQIGAEVLGQSDAPAIDAEVIEMLMAYFDRVGLTGCTLYVNSIGCSECRPKYVETLRAALLKVKEELGPDSQRRIETNPLRVLDSKLESEQAIIEKLPRITDHLCPACREHFAQLEAQLKLRGITYHQNWRLVRGLDYYMRTTFEITAPGLGSQNAVCGGGRYDGLVELLGGPPTKGIGFAIGTDRLILSLQEAGPPQVGAGAPQARDVYIVWMGAIAQPAAIKLARRLRDAGLIVEIPPDEMKIKKALGLADKLGARFAVIIGENEVASGQFTVKRLADAAQRQLGESELLAFIQNDR